MQSKKRIFIAIDEWIIFDTKNNGVAERYFPHDERYNFKDNFTLYLDYSDQKSPKQIETTFIYMDNTKTRPPFDGLEKIKPLKITFPQRQLQSKNEIKILVNIKDKNLLLWKIQYRVIEERATKLLVSIS